jgi:hydroxymethylglutaryl-CoA lyase
MKKVTLYEVGPRDGFQNIPTYIPLETKLEIIDGLVDAGVGHIQVTSFVSPKAIPQMKDSQELARICKNRYPDLGFFALIPNLRGAKSALESGITGVSYVVSLGESHNLANIRKTHQQSFDELVLIKKEYPELAVGLDLATTFGCPFEGRKSDKEVLEFLRQYVDLGVEYVSLCDTIGVADPLQVRTTVAAVQREFPHLDLQIHIHDTRNMGMVNTLAAIEMGVDKIQSTLGGLGGCPYAPGASGNLATEDVLYMLTHMGYETGIDVDALVRLARRQADLIPEGLYSGHLFRVPEQK